MGKTTFILTCEHAGNEIPATYHYLFKGKEEVLYTHKAIDFGALQLAEQLSSSLNLPLLCTATSRLLVEANRSLESEELFSEYSGDLPDKQKKHVLSRYYLPHRMQIEKLIGEEVALGKQVVHFAIHSFTPATDGEVRKAEIGILFDPKRPLEKLFARELRGALLHQNPKRKVLYNSPYPGTTDGLPTHLRKLFSKETYAGFELEINQKFYLNGKEEVWQAVQHEITTSLMEVIKQAGKGTALTD